MADVPGVEEVADGEGVVCISIEAYYINSY